MSDIYEPIPAPPLPAGGVPVVACELGYDLNGESGLGYPYGYGSDVCVPVDPCLVDGELWLDYVYEWPALGTTLYAIQGCTPYALMDEGPVATVTETAQRTDVPPATPQTLPATGIELTLAVVAAALMSLGAGLLGLARR